MGATQSLSTSTESTGPMAVLQPRADQQQSLDVFDKFDLLPPEVRAMIWTEALEEEAKTRFLLYHERYGKRGPNRGDKAVFFPHKKLRSRLLEVNRESRSIGLKFYHLELKVYTRAFEFPLELLDHFDPRPVFATPRGVLHIRPEQDTVIYHCQVKDPSFPWSGDTKLVSANLSAEDREKFRQVWCIDPGWKRRILSAEFVRFLGEKPFEELCSHLNKNFPSNEGIVRLEPRRVIGFSPRDAPVFPRNKNVFPRILDQFLARGSQDVLERWAAYIRVYDKDGQEKCDKDEHQESLDENTDS